MAALAAAAAAALREMALRPNFLSQVLSLQNLTMVWYEAGATLAAYRRSKRQDLVAQFQVIFS